MVRTYLLLAWTWTRAAMQYPLSLVLFMVSGMFVMLLDLAGLAIMFHRVDELGGFTVMEFMYLWGTCQVAFALSDIGCGTTDRLSEHIKSGALDTMLVRPVSPMLQLATEEFSPRKLSRLVPAGTALGVAMAHLRLDPLDVLVTVAMVGCGTVIFCAIWVMTSAVQFVLIDGHQVTKGVTWGGNFMAQYPMSIFGRDFVRGVTFVVPLAFVNWQPSLYVLGHPDPLGLPPWCRFLSPVVAVLLVAVATLAWRTGLRHYRSTGS
ncbi:ABC transporter permease [Actinocorallia longicatena]|uniref:ABC transporter permease n=1 Tax=Actinocorallia longicatena TaxID=111803 RepID=A0ABP6Q6B2_9ACTN